MSRTAPIVALAVVVLSAGCVEEQIDKSFSRVEENVHDRLGEQLAWNRDFEAEQRIAEETSNLLAGELSAEQAVHIALLNNRRLQATYSDVGIAAAQLIEAWLIENPVLTGQIRFAHNRPLWELELVQNFLDVLLLPLSVGVSEAELEATKLRVSAQVIDVAMNTRRTFYRYQARLQLLGIWQDVLTAAESRYEMAVQLRRAGNINELMLAREQASYERLKLDIAEVELAAVQDRERLNMLMGLWGGATQWKAAAELPDVPDEPLDVVNIERQAIERNYDLQAALYNINAQAQQLGLRSIRAALPQLQLGGAVESERPEKYRLDKRQRQGQTEYELEEFAIEEWQAGPAFAIPIPLWNLGQAAYATAEMELLRRWNLYAALAIDIRAAARAQAFRLTTARQRVAFHRSVFLPAWNDVFEQTQLQYNAMFIGVFDLLHGKQEQLQAAQQYIIALSEYWQARTDLEQLLLGSARGVTTIGGSSSSAGGIGGMDSTFQMIREQSRSLGGGNQGGQQ